MVYVELETVKATLGLTGEEYDADLALAIEAASRAVDSMTGRSFGPPVESTRVYVPRRSDLLEIDDVTEVTAVECQNRMWADSDYLLYPWNAPAMGFPFVEIRPARFRLTPGVRVEVTGKFGWPGGVPASVKQAAGMIAVRLMKRSREAPFGIAGVGAEGVGVRVSRDDPDVQLLLRPFARVARLA